MDTELMLDVGQANELKLAFRRSGYTNADIKKLCEGDILAQLLSVVRGVADVKIMEPALPKPELLLEPIGFVTVPATAGRFIARDRFVVNTAQNAPVRIRGLGNNFKKWFLAKIEKPIGETTLRYQRLWRPGVDESILAELGGEERAKTTLTEIYALMEWRNGGVLLTYGYSNIFYLCCVNEILCTVHICWDGVGWFVDASSIGLPRKWSAGNQVFSRNS